MFRSAMGILILGAVTSTSYAESPALSTPPLPETAAGWSIRLIAEAPFIHAPTAVVETREGVIYLAQDPMDLNGPPTEPTDYIITLRLKNGKPVRQMFAENLGPVMGLEHIDDTLFVVHSPYLSAFRDLDRDGVADKRVDLITGLGHKNPAFNGYNDHVASGIRAGMDGFLYITFGDKGIPHARGLDGTELRVRGGGIVRVRPDGSDLELFTSGLRNPLSVALAPNDDAFIYGNDDDSKQWPNAVVHTIDGGHYGYPYEFQNRPHRALPVLTGRIGGAGAQGFCFNEDGLARQFRQNLFFTDWGLQTLIRFEIEAKHSTYRLHKRSDIVRAGSLSSFRPFSANVGGDGNSILLVDWALPSKLESGISKGRLYRLHYEGADAMCPEPHIATLDHIPDGIQGLNHPAHRQRLRAQRFLIKQGYTAISSLTELATSNQSPTARQHALWALDAIGGPSVTEVMKRLINDPTPAIRKQALRAVGIRHQAFSLVPEIIAHLQDGSPSVRKEAAIALGRFAVPEATSPLLDALDDPDEWVAWSVREAIKRIDHWDAPLLAKQLLTSRGKKQQALLWLLEDIWSEEVVDTWNMVINETSSTELRHTAFQMLSALYYQYPSWDDSWFGTNPLIGEQPKRTTPWSASAMNKIIQTLSRELQKRSPVDRMVIVSSLATVGPDAIPLLTQHLETETDSGIREKTISILSRSASPSTRGILTEIVQQQKESLELRKKALTGLLRMTAPEATETLIHLYQNKQLTPEIRATLIPELASRNALTPCNILVLNESDNPLLQNAALESITRLGTPHPTLEPMILRGLQSDSETTRLAALRAAIVQPSHTAIPQLLKLVKIPPLRELSIHALTQVPQADVLDVYLSGLDSANLEIRRGCLNALKSLGDEISVKLHKRISEQGIPDHLLPVMDRILTHYKPFTSWQTIGPFPREVSADVFGKTEPLYSDTHRGIDGNPVGWKRYRYQSLPLPKVELGHYRTGEKRFGFDSNNSNRINVFAHTYVWSDVDRDATLLVGSSGSLRIWVNAQEVYRFRDWSGRVFNPEEDVIHLRLNKGRNGILIQSHDGIGPWQFAAQLSPPGHVAIRSERKTDPTALVRFATKHSGNLQRGKQLFFNQQRLACSKCHSINGQGGQVGPDLRGFADQYNREEAIRSILTPSQRLANGFTPVILATVEGTVLTGLIRSETDQLLELINANGQINRIPKNTIDEKMNSQKSTMPDGLVDQLSAQEFTDLVTYIMSLKGSPASTP